MANEYLRRVNTSGGNRKQWTWSGWVKRSSYTGANQLLFSSGNPSVNTSGQQEIFIGFDNNNALIVYGGVSGSTVDLNVISSQYYRDSSSFLHILVSFDTTLNNTSDRIKVYVNGAFVSKNSSLSYPAFNYDTSANRSGFYHNVGGLTASGNYFNGELVDTFFIDGQALTPDVFGFYKQGKGYISAGSTQATDFRPGQWVPKTPRVIKSEINRRGGFGVNGFYLPMNDSRNFGADFHGDPNSIITLNEKLPQPRVGVASTASVGLGYTDALRADPYAANLVLALPFVSGGLSSGFGDYAPSIKGSGTAKTITTSNVSIASTASYYGSANFFNGSNGYIEFSGSDFDFGASDFTVEMWANSITGNGARRSLYWGGNAAGSDASGNLFLEINASNQLRFGVPTNGSYTFPSGGSISLNQWNHIAITKKGVTVTGYLNGVAVGIDTNCTGTVNTNTNPVQVGGVRVSNIFGGYIQDLRVYKGVAKYTGGFDVPRPYTPVGIATWRQVPDTTANNFATMNPLIEARPSAATDSPASSTIVTFAGGNLDLTNSASSGNAQRMVSFATIGISTGRWYWEVRASTNDRVGISKGFQQKNYSGNLGSGSGLESSVSYEASGAVSFANTAFGSATTLTPPSFDTTNIIGVAVSANNGLNNLTIQFFKDGVGVTTLTGVGATSPVLEWFPSKMTMSSGSGSDQKFNFGQNPTLSGNTTAGTFTDTNGKGLFKYQPPSGFLALCEDNLPTPTISDPGKYFKTVLYTGDGASGRNIVGVGFTPDLVWIKERNGPDNHRLVDSVRGPIRELYSSLTNAEAIDSGAILSFNSDGFSVGNSNSYNESGINHVAWCWRAGAGTTSTNTNGSITSVVSVNQDAGFSIVSYTGNGTSGTVGHGLGKAPKFILIKRRSGASNWAVAGSILGANSTLYLNLTNATDTYGDTNLIRNIQTSTTFELGTDTNRNQSGGTHIAYCWAEIEGFSKFGSYVGNGSADGPFIWTGFLPAWIMIKRTAGAADWVIHDSSRTSTNPSDTILRPNTSDIDLTASSLNIDFLSNGFKIRNTNASYNNAETYIFAAFAQSPFQTANSK